MPNAPRRGRLILKVYPQNDFDDSDFSYARIAVDKSFVKEALRTISHFKQVAEAHPKLEEMTFFSGDVDMIGYFDPGEVYGAPWADEFENSEYILEPSSFVPVKHAVARIQTSQIRVSSRGVYFYAVPKYGSTFLETSTIQTEDLEQWAKVLGVASRRRARPATSSSPRMASATTRAAHGASPDKRRTKRRAKV